MKVQLLGAIVAFGTLMGCDTKPGVEQASSTPPAEVVQNSQPAPVQPVAEGHSNLFHWADSLPSGLAQAKKSKGFVIIKFEATWCAPCKLMTKEAFTDAGIANALKNAVIVPIDVDTEIGQKLGAQYKVGSIPRLEFLKADGSTFGSLEGYGGVDWMKTKLSMVLSKA